MPETIDRLQIEITQSAKGSLQPIENLAKKLDKLKTAVSGKLPEGLIEVAIAVKEIKDAGTITGAIVDDEAIRSIEKLKEAMKGFKVSDIGKLKSAIAKANKPNKNGESLMDVIAPEIHNPEQVEAKFEDIGERIRESLSIPLLEMKPDTVIGREMTQMEMMLESLERANKHFNMGYTSSGLTEGSGMYETVSEETDAMRLWMDTYQEYAGVKPEIVDSGWDMGSGGHLDKLVLNLRLAKAAGLDLIDSFKQLPFVSKHLELVKDKVESFKTYVVKGFKKAKESVVEFVKALPSLAIAKSKDIAKQLPSATKSVLGDYGRLASGAGSIGTKIASGIFGKIASGAKKAYAPVQRFFESIGRIAFYRMVRGAIKSVTQGFSEGVKAMYYWSQMNDQIVSKSLDDIATSMDYARRGFASIASPLIEQFAPAIEYVTNKVVDFFNTVQKTIAVLVGATTWTKAVRKAKSFEKALKDTSKAAKSLQQLMSFDELNNITTPSEGGSGSGNQEDYSGLFTTEKLDVAADGFLKKLKDAIDRGDWEGVGSTFGEKFNSIVDKVRGLDLGSKLGNVLNNAVSTAHGFISTVNFENIGSTIAEGVNHFMQTFDFHKFGETVGILGKGITDMILEAIEDVDGLLVGKSLADLFDGLFDGLKLEKIGKRIAIDFVVGWIKGLEQPLKKLEKSKAYGVIKKLFKIDGNITDGFEKYIGWLEGTRDALNEVATYTIDAEEASDKLGWTLRRLNFKQADQVADKFEELTKEANGTKSATELLDDAFNACGIKKPTSQKILAELNTWAASVETVTTAVGTAQDAFNGINIPDTVLNTIRGKFSQLGLDLQSQGKGIGAVFGESLVNAIGSYLQAHPINVQTQMQHHQTTSGANTDIWFRPQLKAEGGYVDQGQLFVAREAGPELVGQMGSHTAVANNAQIVEGIASGVEAANTRQNELLREQNGILRQLLTKGFTISPSAGLGRVVQQSTSMYRTVTG